MFDSELSIRAVTPTTWSLLAPLIWTGTKGDTFIVPVGFVTDFATVPRFLRAVVQPYGPYTRAAVLHDFLIESLADWQATPSDSRGRPIADSRDADGIFRRVMEDLGTPWATRWTMWAAVRAAALFNPRRAYGRQFGKDAPRVLAAAVLAIPVVLPSAVGSLISLGLAGIINLVTGRPKIVPPRGGPAAGVPKGHDR